MKTFKLIVACVLALSLIACTDDDAAVRVLKDHGYTDITLTGYDMFACSDQDTFKTGFMATTPSGQRVEGTVCSGFLKGATIRFH